jgi:hypothetical protein
MRLSVMAVALLRPILKGSSSSSITGAGRTGGELGQSTSLQGLVASVRPSPRRTQHGGKEKPNGDAHDEADQPTEDKQHGEAPAE